MKIKKIFSRIYVVGKGLVRKTYLYGFLYGIFRDHFSIVKNRVFFESHHGKDFFGNPHAIADYILRSEYYDDLEVVVVAPTSVGLIFARRYLPRQVKSCRKNSLRYLYHLATAEWLVSDVTFPVFFSRRDGQHYLNTWHGTPLKTLGRRAEKEMFLYVSNTQRNFFHCTHLLVPNHHTEEVLIGDYMLSSAVDVQVLRCGYPRNDVLYRSQRMQKADKGFDVAFMPTWRGNLSNVNATSKNFTRELIELFCLLDTRLPDDTTVWVRLHPLVAGEVDLSRFRHLRPFPENKEPYEHLAYCDALITDYSSVLFDFALTKRPILLYTPDDENYRRERNFCLNIDDLPFEKIHEPGALVNALTRLSQAKHDVETPTEAYQKFIRTYAPWDNGCNTERVARTFFKAETVCEAKPLGSANDNPKLLIYTGALINNGIIASFKSLLEKIDLTKFDITILADSGENVGAAEAYFSSLPCRIKFIPLRLSLRIQLAEGMRLCALYIFFRKWCAKRDWIKPIWEREARRILGGARFDLFVNFNGYSWRAAFLATGLSFPSVIFVHNDMAAEVAAGNRVADPRLLELSYRQAKRVATVRKGAESQYCNLHYDFRHKCDFVPNTLPISLALRAEEPVESSLLVGNDGIQMLLNALETDGKFRFINIGRFSPEKGQDRLIDAFEQVWDKNHNTQLYIVGGHGVAENKIRDRAQQSRASRDIFVLRGSNNVMPLLKKMDCFVFSSFYEGIGLVMFESLELGVPIISTDIPGPSEFLSQGYGLVVDNSKAGLIKGMQAAIAGQIPFKYYDIDKHNRYALHQFEKMLDNAIEKHQV